MGQENVPGAPTPVRLFIVSRDGSNLHAVIDAGALFFGGRPSWSPDGSAIAYPVWFSLAASEIHIVNVDGSGDGVLAPSLGLNESPSWTPQP
jgi:Tol biopolymer transport system component